MRAELAESEDNSNHSGCSSSPEKEGKITILLKSSANPVQYNDVLSFTQQDDETSSYSGERKICDNCVMNLQKESRKIFTLEDFMTAYPRKNRSALFASFSAVGSIRILDLPFASAKREVIISWYSKISGHLKFFGYTPFAEKDA